jgi:hypothetical protein
MINTILGSWYLSWHGQGMHCLLACVLGSIEKWEKQINELENTKYVVTNYYFMLPRKHAYFHRRLKYLECHQPFFQWYPPILAHTCFKPKFRMYSHSWSMDIWDHCIHTELSDMGPIKCDKQQLRSPAVGMRLLSLWKENKLTEIIWKLNRYIKLSTYKTKSLLLTLFPIFTSPHNSNEWTFCLLVQKV